MGLFDFVKKQFIDVIQWTESGDGVLAQRFPMADMEIQTGAQLTVRESQKALFVDKGLAADAFGPGLHRLTTSNLPLLTNLKNWDKLFESPFKSDVYFFSTRLQLNRKWGTAQPITIRDKDFGMVRMRAFGMYSYRVDDVSTFHREISGTRETYTVDELDGQLRNTVIASMTDLFGESNIPFIDLAANQDELAAKMKEKLGEVFRKLGLALDTFVVENVSLPEELQKILDQKISMNIIGDPAKLMQYNVAQSMPIMAANEGGLAGAMASMGGGLAMGGIMAQTMGQMMPQAQGTQPAPAPAPAVPAAAPEDPFAVLEKLHGLVEKGILSKEEFEAKKAQILSKL
ncbi:MAG TPA: SPFH domain-containing protein [Fibrobacteria bacterium]|nr:SPFH domain-containing protein [Fibrobacteria bacterium]